MADLTYDVIIAGGGPAGAVAGKCLTAAGAKTLLLEKDPLPRVKVCAGGLAPHLFDIIGPLPEDLIECRVDRMVLSHRYRDSRAVLISPPGLVMVMRPAFDHYLVKEAIAAGCEVRTGDPVVKVEEFPAAVVVVTRTGARFRAGYLIGADGAHSIVARRTGLGGTQPPGVALSAEVRVSSGMRERQGNNVSVVFGVIPWGYGWIFPKKNHLSCGIATTRPTLPGARRKLSEFLAGNESTRGMHHATVRGFPVPCCSGLLPLHSRRVLLVGDAAELVDPLTGEGIYTAALSGRIAADILIRNRPLRAYEEQINEEIRLDLLAARRLMEIFYAHPRLCYTVGIRNSRILAAMAALVAGQRSYRSVVEELKAQAGPALRLLARRTGL